MKHLLTGYGKPLFFGALTAALLCGSSVCLQAAREAADTFACAVMPALFPMMVLTALWNGVPAGARACAAKRSAPRWSERLLGLPRGALPALLLGLLSGSPASAKLCGELAQPPDVRRRLLAYTGVMSPMFFTGTLALWTRSRRVGLRLLACHWLAALLCGELYRLRDRAKDNAEPADNIRPIANDRPVLYGQILRDALAQAANALLLVCGAMMLCAVLYALLSAGLSLAWPGFADTPWAAVLHAALEIGAGARRLATLAPSPGWQAALCGLCGFGGASLWLQSLSFAQAHIRPGELLALRLTQGLLAAALYALLGAIVGVLPATGGAAGNTVAALGGTAGNAVAAIGGAALRTASQAGAAPGWVAIACVLLLSVALSLHKNADRLGRRDEK